MAKVFSLCMNWSIIILIKMGNMLMTSSFNFFKEQ